MYDLTLHNEPRTKKRQARTHKSRQAKHYYNQNRNEIHHRISRLLTRQNCNTQSVYYNPNVNLSSVIKEDHQNMVNKMMKYWGGNSGARGQFRGLQFRKLGRMDKIMLKQNQRERLRQREQQNAGDQGSVIQIRNKSAFLKRVLSRLDNKYRKWILSMAFNQIQKCKKPPKDSVIYIPPTICYW